MDFSLSDEQIEVRDLARKILTDLAKPERLRAVEESEEGIDRALWAELAKADLLGVGLPETAGGGAPQAIDIADHGAGVEAHGLAIGDNADGIRVIDQRA